MLLARTPSPDPRLLAGIKIFNQGRHWHAHEAWEGLWKELDGEPRRFVQGLIFAAALLVHYGRHNPAGVLKHWKNVENTLPFFAPAAWGVDVDDLLGQLRGLVEPARAGAERLEGDPAAVQIRLRQEA